MKTIEAAEFSITGWDEQPLDAQAEPEADGPRITHAVVARTYRGEIQGSSTLHYLMVYSGSGACVITGVERFHGRVNGRTGSFVALHSGQDTGESVQAGFSVVPNTGTGELSDISGSGEYTIAGEAEWYATSFSYQLP